MSIKAEIEAHVESFRLNGAELDAMLTGPHGIVAADIARRAIRVESQAKINATGRPGPRVRSGRLRGSITWRLGEDFHGVYADIGTTVEYAAYLEFGTSRMPAYSFLLPALAAAQD